jgi:hypothetical protein
MGAFPGVILLPRVYPLVLDANMIRGELIRIGSKGSVWRRPGLARVGWLEGSSRHSVKRPQ